MPDRKERVEGVVLGTAIGDAMGYPTEFMSMDSIRKQYGRVEDFVYDPPIYTDDTQMMRAVAEGLLRARSWHDLDAAAREVAEEFIAWANSEENNRAPGGACMLGCRNLERGNHWRVSGKLNGGGCGAAMRSMAYGVWFKEPLRAAEWAAEHSAMTHRSPPAKASAAAVAAIVSALCQGYSPIEACVLGEEAARRYEDRTADMMARARELALKAQGQIPELRAETLRRVLDAWRGWTGHEAVAASVFCFLLTPDSYPEAVLNAINSPGDSDSLGAITGAFCGAYLGSQAIPEKWRLEIEKSDQLHALASRITKAVESR